MPLGSITSVSLSLLLRPQSTKGALDIVKETGDRAAAAIDEAAANNSQRMADLQSAVHKARTDNMYGTKGTQAVHSVPGIIVDTTA